jgi:outer membrane protein TolC
MRWQGSGLGALLGLFLLSGGAWAQETEPSSYSLEEAIQIALESNRDLQNAQLGLRQADEQVREAWGTLYPTIDGVVNYQRNLLVQETFLPAFIFDPDADPDELIPVRFGADNAWTAQLVVTQKLFDAGAFIGVGTAGRVRELQQEIVRGQAQLIASRVRRSYYLALLAREEVRVIQESVDRTEQTLRETEALNRSGLASSYDVLRLQVRLTNLRPNQQRAENALAAVERNLSIQMGMTELRPIRVAGELHQINLASADANEGANGELLRLVGLKDALGGSYESMYDVAQVMRSDLRQARITSELENARVKYEQTFYYPRLNAFFNAGIFAQENGSPSFFGENENQRTTTAYIGLSLEIPIFQGFQRSARVQQRVLARRQAEVQLDLMEQQAAQQIRTALEALEEARDRAEAQRGAVGEARRGFEIVNAQYLAGISSNLDVTEGEVLLRESEFNYAQAIYDYLLAQAVLDEAVGVVPLVDVLPPTASATSVSEE